jgi:tRNA pseudouridine38-40 synthase
VQGLLLEAAARLCGADTRIVGASRTDAGVHALRQTVSLTTTAPRSPRVLRGGLNAALPGDVRVLAVAPAPAGFDARRWASGKRYAYLIDAGAVAAPLLRRFAWHVGMPLDVAAMRRAAVALRGRHDFSALCAAPGRDHPPECHLRAVHVRAHRERIVIVTSADRYLHHMVRNIVGSLVEVGRGARPPGWLGEVLASRDRRRAGPTAPARGLVLVRVLYGSGPAGER